MQQDCPVSKFTAAEHYGGYANINTYMPRDTYVRETKML